MAIVVPMPWRTVQWGTTIVLPSGRAVVAGYWTDDGMMRQRWIFDNGVPRLVSASPDDVVPVIVPSDAEQLGAAIVNLINGGFHVTPVPEDR
jgi:hypothetical protein